MSVIFQQNIHILVEGRLKFIRVKEEVCETAKQKETNFFSIQYDNK